MSPTEEQALRLTRRIPFDSPIFALWVPDGGPDGLGYWLLDTNSETCDDHPAVFYSRDRAEAEARHERANGFAGIEVVELRAFNPAVLHQRRGRKP